MERRCGCLQLARAHGLEVVLHSPLMRAFATARGLFGGDVPLERVGQLYETSLSEHASIRSLKQRVEAFKRTLLQRSESRLAIVGHSGFFRCMIGEALAQRKHELGNLSVWRVVLGQDGVWRDLELLQPGVDLQEVSKTPDQPSTSVGPVCLFMRPD